MIFKKRKKYDFYLSLHNQFFAKKEEDDEPEEDEDDEPDEKPANKKPGKEEIPLWGKKLMKQIQELTKQPEDKAQDIPVPNPPKTEDNQPEDNQQEETQHKKSFLGWFW